MSFLKMSYFMLQLNTNVKTGDTFSLFITYVTGDGPGVVWLDPEQTAGKISYILMVHKSIQT